jgi:NADH-ubiquinone oxidoreductase chain 4L
MILSSIIFLIGILGFILNQKNLIILLISIEIILLAVTIIILLSANNFNDGIGQTFGVFVICIAGAESAIGLAILVSFYRLRGSISVY